MTRQQTESDEPVAMPRLVFIGLDAADARLIALLAGDGTLPTLSVILRTAAATTVRNPAGLYVGALWPTFFTGSSPASHGRYCWKQLRGGTYHDEFYQVEQIRGDPVWQIAEKVGWKTAVVDIPKSFPNPRFKGPFVKDWGTHDPSRGGFQVSGWLSSSDIVGRYGRDRIGQCDSVSRTVEGYTQFRDQLGERAAARAKMISDLITSEGCDVLFAAFSEAHCAGHQCWHLHDTGHYLHDASMRRIVGDPLVEVYVALDRALSTVLGKLTSNDTVILLASHGMGAHYNGVESLAALTMLVDRGLAGCEATGEAPPPHVLSMESAAFRERHRIFPVPNNGAYAAFRLNLVGREPNGKLQPDGAERFLSDFTEMLLSLREADAGSPIFRSGLRSAELFDGPLQGQLPDLLMEWNRDHPIRRIVTPWGVIDNSDGENPRTGDHTPNGMMWVQGPGASFLSKSIIDLSELKGLILGILEMHRPH